MARIGYARVSSVGQNLDRQLDAIGTVDELFTEKTSGKNINDRQEFQACMRFCRKGDTLVITSIDRCARSLQDLLKIVEELQDKGVVLQFLKENMIFDGNGDGMSKLLLSVMGAFAEFERTLIKERQLAGIKAAKARGVTFGAKTKFSQDDCNNIKARVEAGEPKARIARELGVTRQTLYNAISRAD